MLFLLNCLILWHHSFFLIEGGNSLSRRATFVLLLGTLLLATATASALANEAFDRAIWSGNAFDHLNRANNNAPYWSSLDIIAHTFAAKNYDEQQTRNLLNFFRYRSENARQNYGAPAGLNDDFEFANANYEAMKGLGTAGQIAAPYLQYKLKKEMQSQREQVKYWGSYNRSFYEEYGLRNLDKKETLDFAFQTWSRKP